MAKLTLKNCSIEDLLELADSLEKITGPDCSVEAKVTDDCLRLRFSKMAHTNNVTGESFPGKMPVTTALYFSTNEIEEIGFDGMHDIVALMFLLLIAHDAQEQIRYGPQPGNGVPFEMAGTRKWWPHDDDKVFPLCSSQMVLPFTNDTELKAGLRGMLETWHKTMQSAGTVYPPIPIKDRDRQNTPNKPEPKSRVPSLSPVDATEYARQPTTNDLYETFTRYSREYRERDLYRDMYNIYKQGIA